MGTATRMRGRTALAITALAVGLTLGSDGRAQSADDSAVSGNGVVTAKDAVKRTITIGSTTYRITEETKLEGTGGEAIRFSDLPVFVDGSGEARGDVRFEAHMSGSELELDRLSLTEQPR